MTAATRPVLAVIIPDGLPSPREIAAHAERGGLWLVRGEGGTFSAGRWARAVTVESAAVCGARWPAVEWYLRGGVDNGGGRAVGALAVEVLP